MSTYDKTISELNRIRTKALAKATDPKDIAMIENNHEKAMALALDIKKVLDTAPPEDEQGDTERGIASANLINVQVDIQNAMRVKRKKLNNVLAKVAIGFTVGLAIVGGACLLIKRRC